MDRTESRPRHARIRRDGWTPERQLRFLDALARTRSVTKAAQSAGMSRKSAYRLRDRRDGILFAAAWDRAIKGHRFVNFAARTDTAELPESRTNASKARL